MQLPQLTFTRFLAAMGIVLFHTAQKVAPFSNDTVLPVLKASNMLVNYFFALSGFILVISQVRNNVLPSQVALKPFWQNRFARIYPLYALALVLSVGVVLAAPTPSIALTWQGFVANALLVQAWVPKLALTCNYPGWSLSVEALFYLTFPLWFAALRRLPLAGALAVAGGLYLIVQSLYVWLISQDAPEAFTNYFPPLHLSTFVLGIATGLYFVTHQYYLKEQANGLKLAAIASLALIAGLAMAQADIMHYYHDGLFAPLFLLFIVALAVGQGPTTRLFAHPWLQFLGEISYGIYILQYPVYLIWKGIAGRLLPGQPVLVFWTHLLVLMGTSALAYHYFERPLRGWLKVKRTHAV